MEKNKLKRVCIFCECWESGGIESFMFNVLSNIDLNGLEIDIVVSQLKDSIFSGRLENVGINFRELSGNQKNIIKNYRMFSKLLKERQYDVVHMNIFHAISFIYGINARKNGVKALTAHSHNTKIGRCRSYPLKIILHRFFKSFYYGIFNDFWACSAAAAKFMFPEKLLKKEGFELIPNGINTERFVFNKEAREKIRGGLGVGSKPLLLNIGRLCEQKNQTFLLDVMKALADRKYDCVLLLIGEGEKLSELKEKAERLYLTDKVVFYGTSSNIEEILNAGDIFLFPSIFEGFGIAALEAQTAGLPVICSEHIPKEAFVTEHIRTVPLIDTDSASNWAEAVIDVFEHLTERSDSAETVKRKGFDIKETAKKIETKYRS